MTNTTTSLSIVKELRRLAQNPSHREYLLRNDINSILIFVDPDEYPVEVVTEAINALFHLAEEASERHLTRSSMRSTIGLMGLMKKIEQKESYSVECKALAIKIQQLLSDGLNSTPITPRSGDSVITRATGSRNSKRSVKFLGENKRAKVITLQIDELNSQERRQQCIDVLVKVKGVISLTFNMNLRRCIIRAKAELLPEVLAQTVSDTKVMNASQVVKNEEGEEMLLSFENKVDDTTSQDLPSYLEEDPLDSPSRDQAVARPNSSGGLGSMASSWFGSVLNAVNKNLYW